MPKPKKAAKAAKAATTATESRRPTRAAMRIAVPRFDTEAEERAFWDQHDTADYVDWSQAARVLLPKRC